MPSASGKEKGSAPVDLISLGETSFQASVKIIENKIRNLEKRKMKLDAYQKDLADGKELTPDQLTAVGKYSEVIQNLEFSRELFTQVTKSFNDVNKKMKRQQKKEKEDRIASDQERLILLLQLQSIVDHFSQPRVRKDHLNGTCGATKLSLEEVNALGEFSKMVQLKDYKGLKPEVHLKSVGDRWLKLLGEYKTNIDKGEVEGTSLTYKELKDLLVSLSSSDYFRGGVAEEERVEERKEEQRAVVKLPEPTEVVEQPKPMPPVVLPNVKGVVCTAHAVQEIKFMQDMVVQAPHLDPAILAVSSYPPNMGKSMVIGQSVSMGKLGGTDVRAGPIHPVAQATRSSTSITLPVSMLQGPPMQTQHRPMTSVPTSMGSEGSNFVNDSQGATHGSPPLAKEEEKVEEWNHIAPKSHKAQNGDNGHDDGKAHLNNNRRNTKIMTVTQNGDGVRGNGRFRMSNEFKPPFYPRRSMGSDQSHQQRKSQHEAQPQHQPEQHQVQPPTSPQQQNGTGIILPTAPIDRPDKNFNADFRGGRRSFGFTSSRGGFGGEGQEVGGNRGGPFGSSFTGRKSFGRTPDNVFERRHGTEPRGAPGGRGSRRQTRGFQPSPPTNF